MKGRKAEAGIGTLILFIAMILVAAIAAGVLIQTSSSLQSKALYTGSRAKTEVSSQVAVIYLWGEDATISARTVNTTHMKVKLTAGSDSVKLGDSMVQVDTQNSRSNLVYNSTSGFCDDNSMIWAHKNAMYGAKSLVESGEDSDYLERGDVMQLCFALPESIGEGEMLKVSFIPKVGHTTYVDTKTPDVMLTKRIQLYP
ncbi:MAG: archaellin/type IV pilin N-terminal domain-containing protein [Nanoarchaeota archaeon]